ncbi:MAG: VCBS repeat-containing protein, partial [Rhodobacteraceae bacterium]|nr:VCBS repeat-containing protein [Paracoccaceae bacterium]
MTTPTFTVRTGDANPLNGFSVGDSGYSAPAFVDLDGDGDLDIVTGIGNGYFAWYENTTGSDNVLTFTARTGDANPLDGVDLGSSESKPEFGDLDGDGDLDLVAGARDGNFYYFENTTGSDNVLTFTARTGNANPLFAFNTSSESTPALGDLDGDGDLDLVSGNDDGNFFWFENT